MSAILVGNWQGKMWEDGHLNGRRSIGCGLVTFCCVIKYDHEQLRGQKVSVLWGIESIKAEKAGQESEKAWLQELEAV